MARITLAFLCLIASSTAALAEKPWIDAAAHLLVAKDICGDEQRFAQPFRNALATAIMKEKHNEKLARFLVAATATEMHSSFTKLGQRKLFCDAMKASYR